MGFEYGYSLDYPDAIVAWEAQFGDFANNAQVMIDQFIAASEDKWKRMSALTLLLPHGYEGAGPRALQRAPRAVPRAAPPKTTSRSATRRTPAQIFHLLRRQVVRPIRKPLVVMTPKSLLRVARGASALGRLHLGHVPARDRRDQRAVEADEGRPRLLLCSGKVYFDLLERATQRSRQRSRSCASSSSTRCPTTELRADARVVPRRSRKSSGCRKSRRTPAPGATCSSR